MLNRASSLTKLVIGKHLKLSPAFPLLRIESDSFPAFGVPSRYEFIRYKFQVITLDCRACTLAIFLYENMFLVSSPTGAIHN